MTPEQRLEQAVRFTEMQTRRWPTIGGVGYPLIGWLQSKQFSPEDEQAIRGYVARLMAGEDPEGMVCTDMEQTGEAA